MEYLYQLAGLRVLCKLPYPLIIKADSVDFLHPFPAPAKIPRRPSLTLRAVQAQR